MVSRRPRRTVGPTTLRISLEVLFDADKMVMDGLTSIPATYLLVTVQL